MSTPDNNSLNTIATNLYGDTQVLNFNFPTISNNELFKKQDGDNITGTKIYSTGTNTSKTLRFNTDDPVISTQVGYIQGEIDGALEKLHLNTTGSVTDGITITSQGRVGIGIVEPEEDLEVDGSIQIDSANVSKLKFQKSGPSPHALGEIDAETDGTNGGLIGIKTKVDGVSVTEKLRINNQGAIGIGGANYGSPGQVIVSRGPDNPVEWADQADTFSNTKVTNYLRLGNQSRNQNIVFGWSGNNLAGNSTEHVIKTINYNQQNSNWNMMGVTIYYCIAQHGFGIPYGPGKAYRDFYFTGTSTSGGNFGSSFNKTDTLGNNGNANFKLNRISGSQWQLVYYCTNSNTTQVSVEVHMQVSYANLY